MLPYSPFQIRYSNLQHRARCVIKPRFLLSALVGLTATLLPVQAMKAQDAPAPEVARISVVRGDVSTRRGDSKDWMAATANAPLVPGDTVATGPVSRTEVQLD